MHRSFRRELARLAPQRGSQIWALCPLNPVQLLSGVMEDN